MLSASPCAMHTTEIELSHVPDVFRLAELPQRVRVLCEGRVSRCGECVVARVLPFDESDASVRSHFHVRGSKITLRPGDVVPLVVAARRSMMEFASAAAVPSFGAGSVAYIVGGDGYCSSFECGLEEYGRPVSVEIVGVLVREGSSTPRTVTEWCGGGKVQLVPNIGVEAASASRPFVVAVCGSRMDVGKSTACRRIIKGLKDRGFAVVAGKLTGFGCRYETTDLCADYHADFTDVGLTCTCVVDEADVVEGAVSVLHHLLLRNAPFVVVELGGGVVGPYRVGVVVSALRAYIDFVVFTCFDMCGLDGGKAALEQSGVAIDLVTGPLANTSLCRSMVIERHCLRSESNRGEMHGAVEAILSARENRVPPSERDEL